MSEERAEAMLAGCPDGCVLVSHSPPRGVADRSSSGKSLGSVAVREAVLRRRSASVVCGHIYGSGGRWETVGDTPVVDAGPAGVEWTLKGGL